VTPKNALRFTRRELQIEGGRRLYLYEFHEEAALDEEAVRAEPKAPDNTSGRELEPEVEG